MTWVAVSSSDLQAVSYSLPTQTLSIRFHSGGICHYHGVPGTVYDGLMAAGSKGRYFHVHIKDRYPFTRG